MKALILKDLYVLTRQGKMFLLMIVLFSLLPGQNMQSFAVIYAAMLPYTALAYDERSHWDQLAGMLPYSITNIVAGKYVLGWLLTSCAALLCTAAALIMGVITGESGALQSIYLSFFMALIVIAITLPPMFRFGVERGRMLFIFFVVFAVCGSTGFLSTVTENERLASLVSLLLVALPVAAVVLTAISIPLSVKLYRKRSI